MAENIVPFALIFVFVAGTLFGLLIAFIFRVTQTKNGERLAREILRESENRRQADEKLMLSTMQNNFGKISLAVVKETNARFVQIAEERLKTQTTKNTAELDTKKRLIDQQLDNMVQQLGKVTDLVKEFENDRDQKYGALTKQLTDLNQTSSQLQQALANAKSRGQWGERIAEDILQMAGFIDGVNYRT